MHSWEIGTLAEALTELEWPQLAVFAPGSIPPLTHLRKGKAADVLSIAEKWACLFYVFPLGGGVKRCLTLLVGNLIQRRREQATESAPTHRW